MLLYNNNSVIFQQILQAGETGALSDRRPLTSFCRCLSAVQITTSTHLTQSIYSPRRLILCMPFHSSLFQCSHCDMNLKMDELYTGKQRWGKKPREERGEAVMHALLVQLMFSCLWCCASCLVLALKDTFMKLLQSSRLLLWWQRMNIKRRADGGVCGTVATS